MGNLLETVKWYQTILKVAGGYPDLPVNGNHNDSNTKEALMHFQKSYDLKGTGFLEVDSNGALNQTALEWIYRKCIPNQMGKWSQTLKDEIKQFQRDYGLEPDGDVGPLTREVMMKVLLRKLPTPLRNYHASLGQGKPSIDPPDNGLLGAEFEAKKRLRGVIRDDDREPVDDTTLSQNRWVCLLQPTYPGKLSFGQGTGVLISPCHILTAAHVICDDVDDSKGCRSLTKAISVRVIPGFDDRPVKQRPFQEAPFNKYISERSAFFIPECDSNGHFSPRCCYIQATEMEGCVHINRDCDYALIKLKENIGNKEFRLKRTKIIEGKLHRIEKVITLGYWGKSLGYEIVPTAPDLLNGGRIITAGYPGEKQGQWKAIGEVDNGHISVLRRHHPQKWRNRFAHTADTTPGQSGSPMWREVEVTDENGRASQVSRLVGIAIAAPQIEVHDELGEHLVNRYNEGMAITEEVIKQIVSWDSSTFTYSNGKLKVR